MEVTSVLKDQHTAIRRNGGFPRSVRFIGRAARYLAVR